MSGSYNGSCRCDECSPTLPVAVPTPHSLRLEANADVWPNP